MTPQEQNYWAYMNSLDSSFVGENPMSNFSPQATPGKLETYDIVVRNTTGESKTIVLVPASVEIARPVIVVGTKTADGLSIEPGTKKVRMMGNYLKPVADTFNDCTRFDDPQNFSHLMITDAVAGDGIEGVIYQIDAAKKITVSSPKEIPLSSLYAFLKQNVCKIEQMQINANHGDVFSGAQLVFKSLSPFNQTASIQRALTDFVDPRNNNDKKIVIDFLKDGLDVSLDDQTAIFLKMPGDVNGTALTQLTIQFKLRVFNNAANIHKMTSK